MSFLCLYQEMNCIIDISLLQYDEKKQHTLYITGESYMPDELTREELLKKIRESRIINPEHQTFVNSIKEMSEEMDRLMQVDENGWIMLGSRDKESLLEKYMQAGSSLEKFLEKKNEMKQASSQEGGKKTTEEKEQNLQNRL